MKQHKQMQVKQTKITQNVQIQSRHSTSHSPLKHLQQEFRIDCIQQYQVVIKYILAAFKISIM